MRTASDYALTAAIEAALEQKRLNFINDYALEERPALIWQCMPAEVVEFDIISTAIQETLSAGAGAISDTAWWCAFKSHQRPTLVFDGIASLRTSDAWVAELHLDGHLLAGVWTFPEVRSITDGPTLAVADFYAEAFRDFVYMAQRIFAATQYEGAALATCTVLHASKLAYASRNGDVCGSAPKRNTLRWPIHTVADEGDWEKACRAMIAQFMRTYSRTPPKTD